MVTNNSGGCEDNVELLQNLLKEVCSNATKEHEKNSHLVASLEATIETMFKSSNQNLDEKMLLVNERLDSIKDEVSKSTESINSTLRETMNALNKSINDLTSQLKVQKMKDSSEIFPRINAKDYAYHKGTKLGPDGVIGYFDNGDYLIYKNLNFGSKGTTKSIRFCFAKGMFAGRVVLRLGGEKGRWIGEFTPHHTGSYSNYETKSVDVDLVEGVHDLTLVATGTPGVMDLKWFELSGK